MKADREHGQDTLLKLEAGLTRSFRQAWTAAPS
jgi:hypothetical protein